MKIIIVEKTIPLIFFESITEADIIYLELNYNFKSFFINIETLEIYGVFLDKKGSLKFIKIGTLNILGINELEIEPI